MQTVWSSIALACLVAGADAFGVMPEPGHPEPGHPTCAHGHTGDLAFLLALGGSCAMVSPGSGGNDPSKPFACELPDGSDNTFESRPGVTIIFKDVCPETCGAPCGHAPTEDHDAVAGGFINATDCKALADAGACASELLVNWFCGESCRGGAPWDECMWAQNFHATAQEQIDAFCADPQTSGYEDVDACVTDSMTNWLMDPSTGTCPMDMDPSDGSDCYVDIHLANYGSTEVHNCPGVRRRKLTRSGTHSGAMKTKGKFALTASGSK
jgi:hypothetical protein